MRERIDFAFELRISKSVLPRIRQCVIRSSIRCRKAETEVPTTKTNDSLILEADLFVCITEEENI
jgi:hypothetical protein